MYNQNYSSPTTLGIDERWERVLAYALIWVSGLILLFVEHRNQTVRRHAMQSVIIFGGLGILGWLVGTFGHLLGWVPLVGGIFGLLGGLIGLVMFVLWILLMVLAYFNPNTIFVGPRNARYV
ncbi:MAG TPA: hypothetical protein VFS83_19135 [Ktedonobacterales bacterium]|nr:hypothetical protein [Ktedonobacterales bacterium]